MTKYLALRESYAFNSGNLYLVNEKTHMGDRLEFIFIDNYNEEEDKRELDLNWFHRYRGE